MARAWRGPSASVASASPRAAPASASKWRSPAAKRQVSPSAAPSIDISRSAEAASETKRAKGLVNSREQVESLLSAYEHGVASVQEHIDRRVIDAVPERG